MVVFKVEMWYSLWEEVCLKATENSYKTDARK